MDDAGARSDWSARGATWWRARWRVVVAAGTAVAVAAILVLVVATSGDGDETTAVGASATTSEATTSSRPTTSAATTTTAPPATATTQATPPVEPSAADTLDGFFAAAATMDEQLRAAADAINGAGPPWPSVSEQLADAVRAADLEPVAEAIPAGLPHDLLQAVILVHSDLSSRRFAMASFGFVRAPGEPVHGDLLEELGNGHEAAERFDADLAAARELAASQPPVAVAAPGSRATAELLVLLDYVHKANGGCDSRGGAVIDHLPVLTWETDTGGTIHGFSGDIEFVATLGPDGTWTAYVNAC
jgi:hypothetical protein